MTCGTADVRALLIVLALCAPVAACADTPDADILLNGDSITHGLAPYVRELLPCAVANKGNARDSKHLLDNLPTYLEGRRWRIIYFNAGMWDFARRIPTDRNPYALDPTDQAPRTHTISEYKLYLIEIVQYLQENQPQAKLVFAETTDVPQDSAGRLPYDPVAYNRAAESVMDMYGVPVLHLRADMLPYAYLHKVSGPNKVHYLPAGYQVAAGFVVDQLQSMGGCP